MTALLGTPPAYDRITAAVQAGRCVILDGGVGTELAPRTDSDDRQWAGRALVAPEQSVRAVHRRYAEAGCDVISTNTWALAGAARDGAPVGAGGAPPRHWMDLARTAVRAARAAIDEAGRSGEVAVAFSLNDEIDTRDGLDTVRLLTRVFEDDPPDLLLLETLSSVRGSTYGTVETLLETGLPVWLGFQRCRHGLCGVYGQHWGGPEGDAFGRAARRFEQMGVGALLINCVPPDHVDGMLPWLRDFTDLPLGVSPNLGHLSAAGWQRHGSVEAEQYAQWALRWRAEGAQLVGGCCGVRPEHVHSAREALDGTTPGTAPPPGAAHADGARPAGDAPRWTDGRGRSLFPLDVPELVIEPGVQAVTQSSLLVWEYLDRERVGAHRRCLDVGCGSGLLAVQLARNGATHVHALDADPAAVKNTLTNAFRNGVADRVTAHAADLYPWVPDERYDVIVANLCQLPADPSGAPGRGRTADFWGRTLIDHLIRLLPEALADDGAAYLLQLSIVGERRTAEQLEALGYEARVVAYSLCELRGLLDGDAEQIAHVENRSDAYHVSLGGEDLLVAYLLEVTRKGAESWTA
ncbi:homocysteine S-methyltransferase family protein [Conexibacter woesei]|uniref:Homocysteine S-methyltransferase n=1 Tax=Conexibacter woesei (strain DSM 14684 / CCUG 47730 / CIP 108061 / JCM 11494 / NBRC 100937 / ID131577) TaxID=469383 RepID=D3F6Z9_CONWI|nr:homocysteine S-methyltransferase family protein [Conexibacter woesei]ADB52797.1 homocysteine S-methyltransferase [Conexibacter woesei DSM 14684]